MKLPSTRLAPRHTFPLADAALLDEILTGLKETPKRVHPKFLYNARGSALFDRICELPEYYLTRTETAILREHAPAFIRSIVHSLAHSPGAALRIVEMGSGASQKTRILLDALQGPATYVPVDISRSHLMAASHALRQQYPNIDVLPLHADFTQPFAFTRLETLPQQRTLVFFPGSTIGNFHRAEGVDLLRSIARLIGEDGVAMVGADLRKDFSLLERAYDDSAGVTAAFNRNVLVRFNEEFGADFDLSAFEHRAPWVEAESRIEMHLVCHRAHTVHLGAESIPIAAGEWIRTESCHKYTCGQFAALAAEAGLEVEQVWLDRQQIFSVQLLKRASGFVSIH